MAVTSRTLDTIRSTLLTGLIGVTLTGAGSPSMAVTLTQSDDARQVTVGTRPCVDGGVSVWRLRSSTTGTTVKPSAVGGAIQRLTRSVFLVTVGLSIEGVEGGVVAANLTSLEMQLVNAVEAALEPASGAYTNVENWALRETVRDAQLNDFLTMSVEVTVIHPWIRS